MKRVKIVGMDFYKCLKYSSLVSCILVIVSGVISLLISRGSLIMTLEGIKGGLFVAGSMGLIIGAGSMIKKDRSREKDWLEWKQRFHIFSYRVTFIIMSIVILLYGCMVDEILFILNH